MSLRTVSVLCVVGLGAACTGPRTSSPSAAPPRPPRAGSTSSGAAWSYEVRAGDGGSELAVEGLFAKGFAPELGVDRGAAPFVKEVEVSYGAEWTRLEARGDTWLAPGCGDGCRVRYRFALDEAARALQDGDRAERGADWIEAPPSTWLLHPMNPAPDGQARYRAHVATPPGLVFLSGAWPARDGEAGAFEADVSELASAPYSAFGNYRVLHVANPELVIGIVGKLAVDDDALLAWISDTGRAIAGFYGRFPVPRLLVLMHAGEGSGVSGGKTNGGGGATVTLTIGAKASIAALRSDWRLAHEMAHTALPGVNRRHHWLEEGLADYVEPFARARAGLVSPEEVWTSFVEGLPKGQPEAGDRGLDGTTSWGRTYWGGALYCLLADLRIRSATNDARSLDDALKGILAAGGSISVDWPLQRVLAVGDAATGTSALRDLHAELGGAPKTIDLDAIWRDLGVVYARGRVTFDDRAPHAATRRKMTERAATTR